MLKNIIITYSLLFSTFVMSQDQVEVFHVVMGKEAIGNIISQDLLVKQETDFLVRRLGGTPSDIRSNSSGKYQINLNGKAELMSISVSGNDKSLTELGELVIMVNNLVNLGNKGLMAQVYDAGNKTLVDQRITGTLHKCIIKNNITILTFPNMNGFGGTGFYVEIR